MITEDYVSFETAKLLKEKGFDEYGMYFYTLKDEGREGYKSNKRLQEFAHNSQPEIKERAVSCPTLQMAMKWLREVHNIYLDIHITNHSMSNMVDIIKYYWVAVGTEDAKWITESTVRNVAGFKTYNEAAEDAIKYCLENLI